MIKRTNFIKEPNIKRYFLDGQYSHIYFTQREYECIKLVAKGKSLKEIGISLNLSPRTVETHLEKARKKLGSVSLSELVNIYFNSILSTIK